MSNGKNLLVSLGVVLFGATAAMALPVTLDGNIDVGDSYFAVIDDPIGEVVFESASWDIDNVYFDKDASWYYIGLDTVGSFDRNGGNTSFAEETMFFGFLKQLPDGTPIFLMEFTSTASTMSLKIDGVPVADADWDGAIGTDLELRIAVGVLAGLGDTLRFKAQLDDNGFGNDDQVSGDVQVPEPGTVALLVLGGLAALLRRRTR